jgi:hypothetical protein
MQRALRGLRGGVDGIDRGPAGQAAAGALRSAVAQTAPRLTGRLASSFAPKTTEQGAGVESDLIYAGRQNYGGGGIVGTHYAERALARATAPATAAYNAELAKMARKVEA